MKKYFLLLIILFICPFININGQTKKSTISKSTSNKPSNEIEFLGKPIDIVIDNFQKNLITKGFKLESNLGTKRTYLGTFSGYPNCKIIVDCQPQSKIVRKIEIQFPELKGENIQCKDAFDRFSTQYRNKYNKIATIQEGEFSDLLGIYHNVYYTDNVKVTLTFVDSYKSNFVETEDGFSIVILNQKVIDIKEKDDTFSDDI